MTRQTDGRQFAKSIFILISLRCFSYYCERLRPGTKVDKVNLTKCREWKMSVVFCLREMY